MPRTSDSGQVVDSNTGVVIGAKFHGSLRGGVVVNDGRRPDCDEAALNLHINGDRNKWWGGSVSPCCIPRRIPDFTKRDEGYEMAVQAMIQGKGYPREFAEWQCDQVLLWGADSISCAICKLTIFGICGRELVEQAREYHWKLKTYVDSLPDMSEGSPWRCPTCSRPSDVPVFEIEQFQKMAPDEFWGIVP